MVNRYKVFASKEPVLNGLLVTFVRFVSMVIVLALLPFVGVGGWWLGFGTNIVISNFGHLLSDRSRSVAMERAQ